MNDASSDAVAGAHRPAGHPPVKSGKIGVLIANLGTPDATDYSSMRRYLKEFLSDKRVIEEDSLTWKLVFNLIILTRRPASKGRDYDSIWNRELNESPLKTVTRSQAQKLAASLAPVDRRIEVDWGMRYGNPSVGSAIDALMAKGCDRILFVPLYPQYAAATTATACDAVFKHLMTMRWQPTLRVAPPYFDEPVYIEALASSMREEVAKLSFKPDVILASFHGIPQDYFDKGDPYYCHCAKTTRRLRDALGYSEEQLRMTFQSRFGTGEWIKPYPDKTVEALAKSGVKSLAIVTPGFSADCLETLEEIAVENGDIFKANGGVNFAAIPCLNDSRQGMDVIRDVVLRELRGWVS
ncbi:MAG: ferrochelatase [Pseudorhodoplanes sp.]